MEDYLLISYIRKQLNKEEVNDVDQWLLSASENRKHFEELQKVWLTTGNIPELENPNMDKAWGNLDNSITRYSFRKAIRIMARVAAVAVIAILIASIFWNRIPYFQREQLTSIFSGDSILRVAMSDSSIVWLNKHSTLTYGNRYNGKQREVILAGEGFFKVHRNVGKPFMIKTQGSIVKVLGTSFNVKSDLISKKVIVALFTGKVSFREEANEANEVILTPNQVAEYKPGNKIDIASVSAINDNAWLTCKLTFKNQTWDEISKVLETIYHKKVIMSDHGGETKRLSAKFDHQSFEEVLSVLCTTSNYKFKLTNDTAIIYN